MTKYRSYRIIDGKGKWVIVDNNGKIIDKNPSKEDLKSTVLHKSSDRRVPKLYYNRTNTCDRCGEKLVLGKVWREYNREGNWTGNWVCGKCQQRYDPNSLNNIIKSMANRRTGNINPNCTSAKGDLFEELTCRWRGVKNLNIENDNYESSIDHSRDSELGIILTKGKFYDPVNGLWKQECKRDHNKEFHNLIFYCVSNDGKIIERIYIFPKEEIIKRIGFAIVKNPTRTGGRYDQWYEKYRCDESIVKYVNNIFQIINIG